MVLVRDFEESYGFGLREAGATVRLARSALGGQLRDEAATARSRTRNRNRTTLSCLLGLRSIPLRWSIPLRLSNHGVPP